MSSRVRYPCPVLQISSVRCDVIGRELPIAGVEQVTQPSERFESELQVSGSKLIDGLNM